VKALVACTPSPTPGVVLHGTPGIEVLEGVIYRPLHDAAIDQDPGWGIYGPSGELVEAAAYRRGPGPPALVGQSERIDGPVSGSAGGTFLYGGVFIGHFGHFILSSLARLWLLADPFLRASIQNFPILFHAASDPADWFELPHAAELLGALDLSPARLVRFTEPVRIARLIVPRPSVVEMRAVHPGFLAMTSTICRSIGIDPDRGGPVWLSRTRLPVGTQGFENEGELGRELARMGVEIVYPEQRSVAAMAGLFAGRPVVAGTVASAFMAALFCPKPAPIVALSPSPIVNPSFPMLDQAAGHRATYLYAESDHLGIDMGRRIWSAFRLRDPAAVAGELLAAMQKASFTDSAPCGTSPPC
jgi:hypothetical protein